MDAVGRDSSLLFHLLLLCAGGCCGVWFVITFALLMYKATLLHFPPTALPMEIISAILVGAVETAGVQLGTRGNLTDDAVTIALAAALLLLAAVGAVYFMWLQTYVMALDAGLSAALLALNALAAVAGTASATRIVRARQRLRQRFAQGVHAKAE